MCLSRMKKFIFIFLVFASEAFCDKTEFFVDYFREKVRASEADIRVHECRFTANFQMHPLFQLKTLQANKNCRLHKTGDKVIFTGTGVENFYLLSKRESILAVYQAQNKDHGLFVWFDGDAARVEDVSLDAGNRLATVNKKYEIQKVSLNEYKIKNAEYHFPTWDKYCKYENLGRDDFGMTAKCANQSEYVLHYDNKLQLKSVKRYFKGKIIHEFVVNGIVKCHAKFHIDTVQLPFFYDVFLQANCGDEETPR